MPETGTTRYLAVDSQTVLDGNLDNDAARDTPQVNTIPPILLTANPNGANPQRLGRNDYPLCDLSHDYDPELREWDGGKMDRFVSESIDYERSDDTRSPSTYGHVPAGVTGGVTANGCTTPLPGHSGDQATNKEVMDYYDGNTVTALWNYAQHGVLFDLSLIHISEPTRH